MKIIYFKYKTPKPLMLAWGRIQEYTETDYFKGQKNILREAIQKYWYPIINANYFSYWTGINIKGETIKQFLIDNLYLYPEEMEALTKLKKIINISADFYLVGGIGSDDDVLQHELHHAYYNYDKKYKKRAQNIIKKYNIRPIQRALKKHLGYSDEVTQEECMAHLIDGGENIQIECKTNLKPYRKLQYELLQNYVKRLLKDVPIFNVEG